MRGMLDAVRERLLHLERGARTVFRGQFGGRPFSLTIADENRWLQTWAAADEASLTRGLLGFTEVGEDAEGRFAAFARAADEAQAAGKIVPDAGAVLAFGSLFNFAIEPQTLPVTRAELFERLERMLGHELPADASVTEQYAHHLEFARSLEKQMKTDGIPIRDMVDTQSLISVAAEEHELLTFPISKSTGRRHGEAYLSVCAIYRDEAPYLREWIEFHRLVGAEKFFLYDNGSKDAHLEALAPYLGDGTVILHDWPVFPAGQEAAFEHCLKEHREDSRWIAFIDIDEFLFSPTHRPVSDLLVEHESWPGVGVNSVFFGTSGHRTRPAGLVIETYLENDGGVGKLAIKSIVDPKRTSHCLSVHHFQYLDGMAVNEHGYPIHAQFTKSVSHSRLRINHYWAKSEEQFRAKCAKPGAGKPWFRPWYDMRRLSGGQLNDASHAISGYAPALRKALADVAARADVPQVAARHESGAV
jgi:hypothetical protein